MTKESESTEVQVQTPKSTEVMLTSEMTELLQQAASTASSIEKASTPFISIKGKKFTLDDAKLGTSMDCVVLATAYDNSYYDRPYDPDTIVPPACFSLSIDSEDMAPHPSSPNPQHPTCKGCPNNEYGTALQGKGKACKNGRRLLLAAYDGDDNYVGTEEIAIVRLPPTSLKAWASYAKSIPIRRSRPVWSVATKLVMDEDEDWPKINPVFIEDISDQRILKEIVASKDFFVETVLTPYDVSGYTPYVEPANSASKKSKMS